MGKTKNNVWKFSHCGFAGKVSEKSVEGRLLDLLLKTLSTLLFPCSSLNFLFKSRTRMID